MFHIQQARLIFQTSENLNDLGNCEKAGINWQMLVLNIHISSGAIKRSVAHMGLVLEPTLTPPKPMVGFKPNQRRWEVLLQGSHFIWSLFVYFYFLGGGWPHGKNGVTWGLKLDKMSKYIYIYFFFFHIAQLGIICMLYKTRKVNVLSINNNYFCKYLSHINS